MKRNRFNFGTSKSHSFFGTCNISRTLINARRRWGWHGTATGACPRRAVAGFVVHSTPWGRTMSSCPDEAAQGETEAEKAERLAKAKAALEKYKKVLGSKKTAWTTSSM